MLDRTIEFLKYFNFEIMPTLYIISGCNGAGKTTASYTILPEILNCKEFVNADAIAAGLSPFQPEKVAFEAGRLMLLRIEHLISLNINFAVETTLSTKSYVQTIKKCKEQGYEIVLIYFWLRSTDLAIVRIKERVERGGHHIPDEIVKRRYKRGLENLCKLFIPLSDYWLVVDNSKDTPDLIAEGHEDIDKNVLNEAVWETIKSYSNEK
jgi:predicted ABC-type ATPase